MARKKKQHHEEHADETWLLPYSDLLTLLLALFIVMFAISNVDKEKLQKISQEFNAIFSSDKGVLDLGEDSPVPSPPSAPIVKRNNTEIEEDMMAKIKNSINEEIEKNGYSDRVKVEINPEGLAITIQDVVLFNSGDAEVLTNVMPLLLDIAKMLNIDNNIKVVGYTDNVPIRNSKYRSNWDLSAMRAINVMSFLADQGKLNPERFSIQGYGQYSPKFDNATEEGRAKNRRVEIILVRKYPLGQEDTIE